MDDKRRCQASFGSSRTYVALLIPVTWFSIIFFYESPCIFNSKAQAEINDPLIFTNRTMEYNDYKQVFNNAFFCLGNAFMYLTLWVRFHRKFAEYFTEAGNQKDKFMFIQVTIISSLNIISGILYTLMLYVEIPVAYVVIAHSTYQLIHCSPAFIYLIMNKSIRRQIGKICCGKQSQNRVYSSNPGGATQPNSNIDRSSSYVRDAAHLGSSQI
ncbi:hypothetical protein WR25_20340 [Diploscapter pachys]|uniref:Serpentine receptor class gamma n=1 Tax=Diploscapter pachys TaxID=2018661 RepID=A0A2A2JP14_9BILA|nr:hypothetical protein WR25_20340 [Diploscapter pachys]